jgi:ATP-binding cassette subfamily B protein RaxB
MFSMLNKTINLVKFRNYNKLPIILQAEGAECGLACIAMVLSYHGHKIDLHSLRNHYSVSLKGANLLELMSLSDSFNLSSRALKLDTKALKNLKVPAILHWEMDHFVVLKKVFKNKIIIHDPALGELHVDMNIVDEKFTGIALELYPDSDFTKVDDRSKLELSMFWNKITGLKSSIFKILLLSICLQFFVLITPYYIQIVTDEVIVNQDYNLLAVLAIGFFIVSLFETTTFTIRSFLIQRFGSLLSIQMGTNLFRHLLRVPLEYFEKRHIGDISSRFNSLHNVRNIIATGIVETLVDGFMAIATFIMIFIYSPVLSLIVLLAVTLYLICRLVLYKPLHKCSEKEISDLAKNSTHFLESVRGIQSVKLFGREVQRHNIWQNSYADALNSGISLGNLKIGFQTLNKLILGSENIVVIYIAATLVMEGSFTVGMLFAFMTYKRQFVDKIINLIEKLIEFKMIKLHLERIADIVSTEEEKNLDSNVKLTDISGKLQLKNLDFRYSSNEPLLFNKLNLEVLPGESIAIVGPSGCGKSSLIKLMLGLLRPENGNIYIDDNDILSLGMKQFRSHVASVMQNDNLFAGSIGDNISFFDPQINILKVMKCAQLSSIHNDIASMPLNYKTLVGDMGSSLSGGQIQRLLLARALYSDPKIIFLDEATSHLNIEIEKEVNNAIKSLNITKIIIAHRIETILSADRVILLENGIIRDVTNNYKDI